MNKKPIIYLIFFIFITGYVIAETSSSSISWLARKQADSIYCSLNGNCTLSTLIADDILLTGNLTFIGGIRNVTIINQEVVGTLTVDGNLSTDYLFADTIVQGDIEINDTFLKLDQSNFNHDDYIIYDEIGYNFTFNISKLTTKFYNATQASAIDGSIVGDISLVSHNDGAYDGITINITEQVAAPALDLRFNFTGVEDFNGGLIRYYTSGLSGSSPIIQLWDYDDNDWEDYPTLTESPTFILIEQGVFDSSEHIQDGVVQMRLYKASTGNINNKYYVDWVAIYMGFGVPAGNEADPFAIHKDGTSTLSASIPFDQYDIYDIYNVNATQVNTNGFHATGYTYVDDRMYIGDKTDGNYYLYFSNAGTYEGAYLSFLLDNKLHLSSNTIVSGDINPESITLNDTTIDDYSDLETILNIPTGVNDTDIRVGNANITQSLIFGERTLTEVNGALILS